MGAGSDVCASLRCARGRQIRKAGRQGDAQPEALQPTSGASPSPPHPTPGKFVLRRPVPTRGEASPWGSARLWPLPVPAPPPASFPPGLRILSPFPFFLTRRLAMECRGLPIRAMAVHSEFRVEPRANRGAPGPPRAQSEGHSGQARWRAVTGSGRGPSRGRVGLPSAALPVPNSFSLSFSFSRCSLNKCTGQWPLPSVMS